MLTPKERHLIFHNGKTIGPKAGRPGIMSQVYLTSSVIYYRNVKRENYWKDLFLEGLGTHCLHLTWDDWPLRA